MATPITRLSGRKKNDLHRLAAKPRRAPNLAETGQTNPLQRVFVAHFDGTQNDLEAVPDEYQETLVAKSYRTILRSENLVSHYYPGVGTRTDAFTGLLEAAFGIGCAERAEIAYEDLVRTTRKWRAENPLAQVHVHVVGFSRGSAIGLHFMNLVHERGIPASDELPPGADMAMHQVGLAAGTVPMSAVLLDTVATGQNDTLTLSLPHSAISVLHLTAGLELRSLFPLTSIADRGRPSEVIEITSAQIASDGTLVGAKPHKYRRLHEVMLAGACHSDVGGSYRDGGIRAISDYLMSEFQCSLGLPAAPTRPTFAQIQNVHAHDSRYLIDRLSPDRPYLRGTRRIIEEAPVADWSGTRLCAALALRTGASVKASKSISDGLELGTPREALPTDIELGQEYKLTLSLVDGRLNCLSAPPGAITCDPTMHSIKLHGVELAPRIHEQLAPDSALQHLQGKNASITLSARIEKDIPALTVIHGNLVTPPEVGIAYQRDVADDWPLAVRSAIMRINESAAPLPGKQAREIMLKCLEDLAAEILGGQASPELKISYTPRGPVKTLEPPIEVSTTLMGRAMDPPAALASRLVHARDALTCLVGTLRQMRIAPVLAEPVTFGARPAKRPSTPKTADAQPTPRRRTAGR